MTGGKIASWGAAAAVAAGSGLAGPPAGAAARAAVVARPQAGYAPISTGPGMCLDDPGDGAGDGQPSQQWSVIPAGGGAPAVIPGAPPALHVDHANMVTADGQVFVPRGFTLSTLQYTRPHLDGARAYASVLAETEAQVNAIAGAWHGNIVRLQVEQDDLVVREDAGDHSYLSLIRAAVRYAQAKGLVVVLNAQTEPGDGRYTLNEPLPTLETVKFWTDLMPYYGDDPRVILDVFNEPRPVKGTTVAPGRAADGVVHPAGRLDGRVAAIWSTSN